jgi:hypothetical protein
LRNLASARIQHKRRAKKGENARKRREFSYIFLTLFNCQEGRTRGINDLWLVAGGGFVLQQLLDSTQVIDFTTGGNAQKGVKGEFVIQFSFRFFPQGMLRITQKYFLQGPNN